MNSQHTTSDELKSQLRRFYRNVEVLNDNGEDIVEDLIDQHHALIKKHELDARIDELYYPRFYVDNDTDDEMRKRIAELKKQRETL